MEPFNLGISGKKKALQSRPEVDNNVLKSARTPRFKTKIETTTPTQPHSKTSVSKSKYSFQIGSLKVNVYKEIITEVKGMDAIANAANENLTHDLGIAYKISKSAGLSLNTDCKNYIAQYGPLAVTQNFISKPGNLKCKGVIHAVGPQWKYYRGKQQECAEDLFETIMNILNTAERKNYKSIAIPLISSGPFGIPLKLCIDMYVKACADYGLNNNGCLKEVHIIDTVPDLVTLVEKSHTEWVKDATCLDFSTALRYINCASIDTQDSNGLNSTKFRYIGKGSTSYDKEYVQYRIHDVSDVFIYTGSLACLNNVECILCPLAGNLTGDSQAMSIQSAAGVKYKHELERDKESLNKDGSMFLIHATGSVLVQAILHVVVLHKIQDISEQSQAYLQTVWKHVFVAADRYKFKSLAVPLIAIGSDAKQETLQVIIKVLISVIEALLSQTEKPTLEELHIVNMDKMITSIIIEEFHQRSLTE